MDRMHAQPLVVFPSHRRSRRTGPRTATLLVSLVIVAIAALAGTVGLRAFADAGVEDLVDGGGAIDAADGVIDRGDVSVFDDVPAVTGIRPELLTALRTAATDAEAAGVRFVVNSGWRSARLQQQLLAEAVTRYGSREEAARWVATPETSAHVTGDAVDLGPWAALDWVAQHGARYGLCQIYGNEPWHVELRPDARAQGCPAAYADPTHDPRLR